MEATASGNPWDEEVECTQKLASLMGTKHSGQMLQESGFVIRKQLVAERK